MDVAAKVVPDLVGPDAEKLGELPLDDLSSRRGDHRPSGPHPPDGLSTPLKVGIEECGDRYQVVLYVENEQLGIVLEPGVARSIAAALDSAAECVLLVPAR